MHRWDQMGPMKLSSQMAMFDKARGHGCLGGYEGIVLRVAVLQPYLCPVKDEEEQGSKCLFATESYMLSYYCMRCSTNGALWLLPTELFAMTGSAPQC